MSILKVERFEGTINMKRLFWMGSSREALKEFPDEVQNEMGMAYTLRKWAKDTIMQKLSAEWEALKL